VGGMTLDRAMSTPGLDKLNIITRGAIPDKPGELLGSKRFSEFLEAVRDVYDFIILDSSPVLSSADAAILGAKADGIIVVHNPMQVSTRAIKRTCAQLGRMSCNIIGIVLNCVRPALIPDALREKYASVDTAKEVVKAPVKKGSQAKLLIPLIAIIIIIAAIWWQWDWIFTEKPEIKVKEVVKTTVSTPEAKPQKPDTPKAKPIVEDKSETKAAVETPVDKRPAPDVVEQKQPDTTPEPPVETEIGFIYQEGRYPYSVYLGSFDSTDQARSALDKYLKAGITSFWVKVNLGEKGTWYRVYSGEFPDADMADAYINEKEIKDGEIKKTAYAVYIGGFTDPKALEEMVNLLKENDYSPYVISEENYDNLLAGAFVTKTGAEELSEELNALGISNRVVLR
jgi:cell division septation protein DedD